MWSSNMVALTATTQENHTFSSSVFQMDFGMLLNITFSVIYGIPVVVRVIFERAIAPKLLPLHLSCGNHPDLRENISHRQRCSSEPFSSVDRIDYWVKSLGITLSTDNSPGSTSAGQIHAN